MVLQKEMGNFKHTNWTKIWAGTWSFLSCSHFDQEYTDLIRFGGRPFLSQSIIFFSKGNSNCWATQNDRDLLGNFLAKEISDDNHKAVEVCNNLKSQVDSILGFIDSTINQNINLSIYNLFLEKVVEYYHHHIYVKYVVDYLPADSLKKLLPYFEEARIYAEIVFKRTEDFIDKLADNISKDLNLPSHLVKCLTHQELENYFKNKIIPPKDLLGQRYHKSVLLFSGQELIVLTGKEVDRIESDIIGLQGFSGQIKGSIAFPGKAIGKARVILDPMKAKDFEEGDVLVAGMTRPDYLSLMKKAAAFVTDGGGILCHAAIVARELKKPCIIGTQKSTIFFKDGDLLEVDADKGIVKKI